MFENLKNELNEVKIEDSLRQKIKDEIREQEASCPDPKTKVKLIRIRWVAAVAAMVAVCLIAVATLDTLSRSPIKTGDKDKDSTGILAAGYEELYNYFEKTYDERIQLYNSDGGEMWITDEMETETTTDGSVMPGGAGDTGADLNGGAKPTGSTNQNGQNDYSTTNTQVEGVDEGDIVKTDGRYIYTLDTSDNKIHIAKAENGRLTAAGSISLPAKIVETEGVSTYYGYKNLEYYDTNYSEMYLMDGYIIAIGVRSYEESKTIVAVYDITDIKNVKEHWVYGQEGSYKSSRLFDGKLYLITNKYFGGKPERDDLTTFIPSAGSCGEEKPLSAKDICRFEGELQVNDNRYVVVGGLDYAAAKVVNTKAVLGGGSEIYMNNTSLYVTHTNSPAYSNEYSETFVEDSTDIIKFSVDKGKVTLIATGKIPGALLNQFSMDEHKGNLRAVTTIGQHTQVSGRYYRTEYTNAVFILDENLKKLSSIEDLAPDETVYSVRFMEDICYFVTFRRVDPLFAVDLSDPQAPKVLSKLKIPGFSRYMHPWEEGKLLGIGQDADEQTGRTGDIKLSMFDISDPTNVTEENKTILTGESYSQALYEHKAVLINKDKNLIGFSSRMNYFILSYTGEGFEVKAELPLLEKNYYPVTRGLFIGEYLYIVEDMGITSYSLKDFAKAAQLVFE